MRDGFAILKVGPWLTFALREALYGLSHIADVLGAGPLARKPAGGDGTHHAGRARTIGSKYYPGTPDEQRVERHFSFSDRIRYYWPDAGAQRATQTLLEALGDREIPRTLIGQYLGQLDAAVAAGRVKPTAHELLIGSITRVLDIYAGATGQ